MNKTVVKMVFGSHLYGLNTPNSDTDYKSVFIPSLRSILLNGPIQYADNSTSDSSRKNTKDDVDDKEYSLGKFIHLAAKGEMMSIDMLHAPQSVIVGCDMVWTYLQWKRSVFYSKNMAGYLGYVRKQTAKYGFKGSRINAATMVLDALKYYDAGDRLSQALPELTKLIDGELIDVNEAEGANSQRMIYLYVVGKKFPTTERIGRVRDSLSKFIEQYGARAQLAAQNEGVDWKAVSHAIRAGLQLVQLYTEGDITFPFTSPLKDSLLAVKTGQQSWEYASCWLEDIIAEVEEVKAESTFPDVVDQEAVDSLSIELYEMAYGVMV